MGIYNLVNFELNCPKCNLMVTEFQTKEGNCDFSIVDFSTVNNFYAICPNCGSFIEFYYSPEKQKRNINDYKIKIIQLKNDKDGK